MSNCHSGVLTAVIAGAGLTGICASLVTCDAAGSIPLRNAAAGKRKSTGVAVASQVAR